jgi:hypothetical protein
LGWQGLLAQALRVCAEPKARRFTRQKSPEKMSEYVPFARWLAAFCRHGPGTGHGGSRQAAARHLLAQRPGRATVLVLHCVSSIYKTPI